MKLLLPTDPGFHEILATPPPTQGRGVNFVCRSGSDVAEEVNERELNEYLEGGEYDQRLQDIQSDFLWLPDEIEFE